ncbi:hypothetical protein SESBI_13177 [Sesbania bispinosa]|nr:hypothetical protein SESBI_13177 [Sesbania bispinosa]
MKVLQLNIFSDSLDGVGSGDFRRAEELAELGRDRNHLLYAPVVDPTRYYLLHCARGLSSVHRERFERFALPSGLLLCALRIAALFSLTASPAERRESEKGGGATTPPRNRRKVGS